MKLKLIVEHIGFQWFMFLIIVINTIVIIILLTTYEQNLFDVMTVVDNVLIWVYVAEILLKWTGLGVRNYFMDGWNKFDFIVTFLSLLTLLTLVATSSNYGLRAIRINKTVRLIRLTRGFSMLKSCRSIQAILRLRPVHFCMKFVTRLARFIQQIFTVLPTLLKLCVITVASLYIYSIGAMELFNSQFEIASESSYINKDQRYTSFDEITFTFLNFMQFLSEQAWSFIIYDVAVRFDIRFGLIALFFDSFFTIHKFILLALIEGMVWEVFLVINQHTQEQHKMKKYLMEVQKIEESGQSNEHKGTGTLLVLKPQHSIETTRDFVVDDLTLKLNNKRPNNRSLTVALVGSLNELAEIKNSSDKIPVKISIQDNESHEESKNLVAKKLQLNENDERIIEVPSEISREEGPEEEWESGVITKEGRDESYIAAKSQTESSREPDALVRVKKEGKYEHKPLIINKTYREHFTDLAGTSTAGPGTISHIADSRTDAGVKHDAERKEENAMNNQQLEAGMLSKVSEMGPSKIRRGSDGNGVEPHSGSIVEESKGRNQPNDLRFNSKRRVYTTDDIIAVQTVLDFNDPLISEEIAYDESERKYYKAKLKSIEALYRKFHKSDLLEGTPAERSLVTIFSQYRDIKPAKMSPISRQEIELEQKRRKILKSSCCSNSSLISLSLQ